MSGGQKSSWWKWLIALVVLAGAGGGWYWWWDGREEAPRFQVAAVTRGDITQVVTATGQLNPVINVEVGSQISGIIQKLFVDFNSTVKSNQVIAQLDPATYQANVHSAEGDLANAEAVLELAQVDARRNTQLFQDKLIAQSDYDKSVATLHQAEAQVRIKTAALERARVDFDRCTILAPVDGVVISRNVDVGQTVAASLQAPTLFVIANNLAKMQIDANVAEADVGGVSVGQDVDFTVDAFPYETFHGKVVQVRNAPITVQNVVTYDTVISVDNPELKLKPGMTANVSIVLARRHDVVRVPNAALRFRPPEAALAEMKTNAVARAAATPGGGERRGGAGMRGGGGRGAGGPGSSRGGEQRLANRTVYALAGAGPKAAPEAVPIQTGISDGINTEVVRGLSEGQSVITASYSADNAGSPGPSNPFGMRRFR